MDTEFTAWGLRERRAPESTTATGAGSPTRPELSTATGCGSTVTPETSIAMGNTSAAAPDVDVPECCSTHRKARAGPARGGGQRLLQRAQVEGKPNRRRRTRAEPKPLSALTKNAQVTGQTLI